MWSIGIFCCVPSHTQTHMHSLRLWLCFQAEEVQECQNRGWSDGQESVLLNNPPHMYPHTHIRLFTTKHTPKTERERERDGPPHHTFPTCLITTTTTTFPCSPFSTNLLFLYAPLPTPLHSSPSPSTSPTLQGEKADLHSAASLSKDEEMNKRKETSRWQSMSAAARSQNNCQQLLGTVQNASKTKKEKEKKRN